jgi:hypothetical protein
MCEIRGRKDSVFVETSGEERCKAPPPSALACGANRGKECIAGFTPFETIPSIKKADHLLGCHDCPG